MRKKRGNLKKRGINFESGKSLDRLKNEEANINNRLIKLEGLPSFSDANFPENNKSNFLEYSKSSKLIKHKAVNTKDNLKKSRIKLGKNRLKQNTAPKSNIGSIPKQKDSKKEKTKKDTPIKVGKLSTKAANAEIAKYGNIDQKKHEKVSAKSIKKVTYTTPFDDVINMLDNKKAIPLSGIIDKFKIDKKVAQEWGEILSENKLIDYFVPIIGEPEFRKLGFKEVEKVKVKKKLNNKILITAGASLAVIFIIILSFSILKPDSREVGVISESDANDSAVDGKEVVEKQDLVKLAFSGNGTYDCRSDDGAVRYAIVDAFIKIEKLDGTSKIVIKDNTVYTKNVNTGEWVESNVTEGIAVPGSGVYPKTKLNCQQTEIEESEFDT